MLIFETVVEEVQFNSFLVHCWNEYPITIITDLTSKMLVTLTVLRLTLAIDNLNVCCDPSWYLCQANFEEGFLVSQNSL